MAKTFIKLAYRKVIDAASAGSFEKKVFHDSYAEFLLKIQAYNTSNNFTRFNEIVANDGRANSLHYKCSFAVLHHIETLKNKIPGLEDTAGRAVIPFAFPEFKVLESDTGDRDLHKVAITYVTDTFTLLENFGEYLLLTSGDPSASTAAEGLETFILKMQPGLSVINYREAVPDENFIFSGA